MAGRAGVTLFALALARRAGEAGRHTGSCWASVGVTRGQRATHPRQLLLGGKGEQRPDKDLGDSVRENANRILGKGDPKTQQGAQQQENPGLFAAMDAPLRGLDWHWHLAE